MSPATPFGGTSQLSVNAPSTQEPVTGGLPSFLQWGPVALHPHVAYDVSYGNGLQASPGQRFNTVINNVAPGISFALGTHWLLDYTPTLRFYSSHDLQDGVDHLVNFNGGTTFHDWTFGLSQSYSSTTQPLIETAAQTDQEVFTTLLTASHTLGSKMSFDLTANQNFRYLTQGTALQPLNESTRDWGTMDWLNYQFVPGLSAGIGLGFTYDNMSAGPDMTSEQYQGRVNWRATQKLSFLLTAGLEDRQFLSSPVPDLLSPIFSASVQYQIFEPTSLSLTASRSVFPSYFQNAITEDTSVSGGLHQRLLGKLYLDLSGSYGTTTYHPSASPLSVPTVSNYDVTSFNARLNTVIIKRATVALYFQKNYISSGSSAVVASLYNYSTTEIGLQLGYRF